MRIKDIIVSLLMVLTATAVRAQGTSSSEFVPQANITIGGNVYGGGNAGNLNGSTTVTVYAGVMNNVFGGARMANVGGRTFVHLDGEHASDDILITTAYGGNDISGRIGEGEVVTTVPTELENVKKTTDDPTDKTKNAIDDSWKAFVRTSPAPPQTVTVQGTGVTGDSKMLVVGSLFGGGNGDYTYTPRTDTDGKVVKDDDGNIRYDVAVDGTMIENVTKPELSKAYLEVKGGCIAHVYGGGNNATVTEATTINIDNASYDLEKSATVYAVNNNITDKNGLYAYLMSKVHLTTFQSNLTSFALNHARVFGGNNKAVMDIMPKWNLQKGIIRDLYSGGNEGAMIYQRGLLLEIDPAIANKELLVINNVYGGCRRADVHPQEKILTGEHAGEYQDVTVYSPEGYRFPIGLSARTLVRGGKITNVYGGNDISGKVYGGNAVGIYTSILGDVYGGGNGSYAYTDNPTLGAMEEYKDFYYTIPSGKTSVEALNDFRPNAEQVSLRLWGESKDNPTIIGGAVYVGGNSATLKPKSGTNGDDAIVELKIGSYVMADKVFLGNNGENMVKTNEADNTHGILEGVLRTYKSTVQVEGKGNQSFSNMNLASDTKVPALGNRTQFDAYMDGCAMTMHPSVVFDKKTGDTTGDPDTYEEYSSYFGSFYCGGNVGSMKTTGCKPVDFTHKIIIFDKLVGGCNNAYVPAVAGFNVAYEGGMIGTPDPTTGNKLELNLSNLKIQPKRWKVVREGDSGEAYNTKVLVNGNVQYELDTHGNRQLEWNTIDSRFYAPATRTYREVAPVTTGTGTATDDDRARRFTGGNIYGGCYTSGVVNGNVVINLDATIVDRGKKAEDLEPGEEDFGVFDGVDEDEVGEAILYSHDSYNINKRRSGVILDEQGMDVLGKALNVFGGGKGKDTEIWGSTTINVNKGYTFQVFGGSQEGVIGKRLTYVDDEDGQEKILTTTSPDGTYTTDDETGVITYHFNGKQYQSDDRYSCYINLKGENAGVSKKSDSSDDMAECEFMYGGGFEGPICGNTVINLGRGRIFNSFAGSCNADILGHAETYIGRMIKEANKNKMGLLSATLVNGVSALDNDDSYVEGFPWVRDITYGGNDLGGRILGSKSFKYRVRTAGTESDFDVLSKVYKYDATDNRDPIVLTANAYTEYLQGRADGIFGGCYGTYDYTDSKFTSYFDSNGDAKPGYYKPYMVNAFVNFRPTYTQVNNVVKKVYGAGQGQSGEKDRDKMQDRSYVLIDIPQDPNDESYMAYYKNMEVFGAGAWGGVGMRYTYAETAANGFDLDQASAVIDLVRGQLGAAYGGSFTEGVTRRTVVNVPVGSTVEMNNIFGGAYGYSYLQPCDVYEAHVNYDSDLATVTGAIFGGNNSERRTLYGQVNINTTVWSNKDRSKKYYGTVYGAGQGGNTWSEYTEVNLNPGATVYEVYGGGKAGKVYNSESIEHYMNFFATANTGNGNIAIPASAWTLGTGYYVPTLDNGKYTGYTTSAVTNLSNPLTRLAEIEDRDYIATTSANYKKYNTNVLINRGATVTNYAYGGGLGELAKVSGTTYIALLGGTVKKDIYAAGTSGAVQDTLGTRKFIASANAYIEGGTCRNVYGGGWNGSVGSHPTGAAPLFDKDGKATNAIEVIAGDFTTDVSGETHVVIGKLQESLAAAPPAGWDSDNSYYYFYDGIPAIQRNAYGGGEGGPVFGKAHLTLNNGYIGYEYKGMKEEQQTVTENGQETTVTVMVPNYEEKIVDETNYDKDGHFIENKNLNDSGCLFGGGYIDNSSVDSTEVKMFGGHVRNAMFGGGEIAAIGRGKIAASGENNSVRTLDVIYKGGKTNVEMFGGHVHRNVFGGGRGYNNLGKQGTLFSDGFVFGQTEVHIHGGEIGTSLELAAGNGNVFGGGDIGFVWSAYEYNDNGTMKLGRGIKKGERYDDGQEGYYYRHKISSSGTFTSDTDFEKDNGEYIPTEDCKVLIEPWSKVTGNSAVSFTDIYYANGHILASVDLNYLKEHSTQFSSQLSHIDANGKVTMSAAELAAGTTGIKFSRSYNPGEYVPTYALNTLGSKNADSNWNGLDPFGIIIHNAVFAGGNTSSGSSTVYANTTSVYGNATASIHDVYHRDLITLGTGHTGGLYGDGNLTFVDGYRGLNITNYGTDYYSISEEISLETYKSLPDREAAYYELKYKCKKSCTDKDGNSYVPESEDHTTKASIITADDLFSLFLKYNETTKEYESVKDGDTDIMYQDAKHNWHPNTNYWTENGVLPVYAGRLMNSIQRADFCGVFGSRMVMQGAQDRVPEIVDYTNYTINRVREVSLNQQHSVIAADQSIEKNKIHGNYFGIYNIVNYLGALSSDVHFRENDDIRVTSNVSNDTRYKCDITIGNQTYAYGTEHATYYNWKRAKIKENVRNNGSSLNKVALASGVYLELTTEKSTGIELYEKDWGYITGVIELDLINVQKGIGGGFVYARNEHREGVYQDKKHVTLTALNADAITRKNYSYTHTDTQSGKEVDNNRVEWETSGNFVHSTQTIIDDCYNISGKYSGNDAVPAHYWYIKGTVYVYDQYISAYTGAPNAYSETVNIPLTITAASHGTMKLLNIQPNKYAYYSSPGVELGLDNKVNIGEVSYYKNDPVSYWDWYLMSRYEKDLFEDETFVVIDSCKIGNEVYPTGYVMLKSKYNSLATAAESTKRQVETGGDEVPAVLMMTKNAAGEDVPVTDSNGAPVYKAFDFVFRESNNLSHNTGYILTYKVNNPTDWNTWYTPKTGDHTDKIDFETYSGLNPVSTQSVAGKDAYEDGPTYRLRSGKAVLGQRPYKVGDCISKDVYDNFEGDGTEGSGVRSHVKDVNGIQATFGPAYLVTKQYDTGDGHHNNPGSVVSEPKTGYTTPALICTSTILLSKSELIAVNTKMTQDEKDDYIKGVKAQINKLGTFEDPANPTASEISALSTENKSKLTTLLATLDDLNKKIVAAYYCKTAGNYGGNYYEGGKNYRGLEAWSSMSEGDRAQFVFNYDALDVLIDPKYSRPEGKKYQYDGPVEDTNNDEVINDADVTNIAGYSLIRPVDYTAEYMGESSLTGLPTGGITVKRNGTTISNVTEVKKGDELSREVYETKLSNEQRHYVTIKVTDDNAVKNGNEIVNYKVYVISTPFQVGNSPYAVGSVLTTSEYNALSDEDKANVTQLVFPKGPNYSNMSFYYCREGYTVGEHGNGVTVSNAKVSVGENQIVPVQAYNSNNQEITVAGEFRDQDPVQAGLVINSTYYGNLATNNQQKDFTIHGIAPTETSTLYVSRESDIFDLSTEKIITVIYQYDYEEVDENGAVTPYSERHVVNIHINFKSGVPSVGDITAPQIIIPGDFVNLREPAVTPGAYEVTGGGWELFETPTDAESHSNGIEYSPQFDPLYWYQDGYYVAYYAKTYLGRTYSNHVPVSVANYHDLKKVMEAEKHHYYVDATVKRDPKIYINDYSGDATGSKNGLDLLKSLYDLSVLNNPSVDEVSGLINDGGTFNGHKPLDNIVRGGANLEFFLRTDIERDKQTVPNPDYNPEDPESPATIEQYKQWSPIGATDNDCFAGILHGDGHHLSGLDHSLFDHLCGNVYNLGVSGPFNGAGIAETGNGYVENCWVMTSGTPTTTGEGHHYAVFGNPTRTGDHDLVQMVNCYYYIDEGKDYEVPSSDTHGKATRMPYKAFYNGTVAYDLNGFYLHKRFYDGKELRTGIPYYYLPTNADGTVPEGDGSPTGTRGMEAAYYPEDYAFYPLKSETNAYGYVENRFNDGDFQYSNGKIPEEADPHMRIIKVQEGTGENAKLVDKTYYVPIWPEDYLFFGQSLTYGYVDGVKHQDVPSVYTTDNRVLRAPAYFRSGEMNVAHFNADAVLAAKEQLTEAQEAAHATAHEAYPDMTAIDFTGYNDALDLNGDARGTAGFKKGWSVWSKYAYKAGTSANAYAFFPPLLDLGGDGGGLNGFTNGDLTRNLLVYTGKRSDMRASGGASQKTANAVSSYLTDAPCVETDDAYRTVAAYDIYSDVIHGHWVYMSDDKWDDGTPQYKSRLDHFLVDKQDFNAPIDYVFEDGKRMWHQRIPDKFVGYSWSNDATPKRTTKGWDAISLPFSAELVTTDQKGEITHFYSNSSSSMNGTRSKLGHEYWLREFTGSVKPSATQSETVVADFAYPVGQDTDAEKKVTNTFLWDYYYQATQGHNQKDYNKDTYQTYYKGDENGVVNRFSHYARLTAGSPYIIGFPGVTFYEFDLSGEWNKNKDITTDSPIPASLKKQTVTFASDPHVGAHILVSDEEMDGKSYTKEVVVSDKTKTTSFTFKPSYLNMSFAAGTNAYTLATDGSQYDKVPDAPGANQPAVADVKLEAFRPYFMKTVTERPNQGNTRTIIFGNEQLEELEGVEEHGDPREETTGTLRIWSTKDKIFVESTLSFTEDVRVVTPAGITVATFAVKPGKTVEVQADFSGMYIVHTLDGKYTKKVTVKK